MTAKTNIEQLHSAQNNLDILAWTVGYRTARAGLDLDDATNLPEAELLRQCAPYTAGGYLTGLRVADKDASALDFIAGTLSGMTLSLSGLLSVAPEEAKQSMDDSWWDSTVGQHIFRMTDRVLSMRSMVVDRMEATVG